MQRRKFVIGLGSLAAGGAAAMGTGAFNQVWANREIGARTVGDANAYLGLVDNGPYANTSGNQLYLDFNGGTDQNGDGLNSDANSRFHNVFKIVNQGTNAISVEAYTLDSSSPDGAPDGNLNGWQSSDFALYWSADAKTGGDFSYAGALHNKNNVGDPGIDPAESIPTLTSGAAIYVHPQFFLQGSSGMGDTPDMFALYASTTPGDGPTI